MEPDVEGALAIGRPESFTATGRSIGFDEHVLKTVDVTPGLTPGTQVPSARTTSPSTVARGAEDPNVQLVPTSEVTIGLDPSVLAAAQPSDFPIVIDPDVVWVTDIANSYGINISNGSSWATLADGFVRTGNPVTTLTSAQRWRSTLRFNMSNGYLGANVENAWLATFVDSGTNSGAQNVYFYWADEQGPHYATSPRKVDLNVRAQPYLFGPYNKTRSGSAYHAQTLASGSSGWVAAPALAAFYNLMSVNNLAPTLFAEGAEPTGIYTYKKFSAQLLLRINRPVAATPTRRELTATTATNGAGRIATWGVTSASDPDGDPLQYVHRIRWMQGATWAPLVGCADSPLTTSATYSCTIDQQYLNQTLQYWSVVYDGHDYQYPSGEIDVHYRSTPVRSDYRLPNAQPTTPVPGLLSPSPINGAYYGVNRTPTLKVSPATDPNSDLVWYRFIATSSTGGTRNSGWQTSTQWTLPADFLRWGDSVAWNVQYADGSVQYSGEPVPAVSNTYSFLVGRTASTNPELAGGNTASTTSVVGVDPGTGNFRTGTVDLSIPASAAPLIVQRSYNSLDASNAECSDRVGHRRSIFG